MAVPKPKGGESRQVEIEAPAGDRNNDMRREVRSSGVSNYAVSPNEKEVAIIVRGEVFVTDVEFGTTKRITNTPQQERVVSWGEDGRTLYYDSERGGSWNLYKSSVAREDDDSFADAVIVLIRDVEAVAAVEGYFAGAIELVRTRAGRTRGADRGLIDRNALAETENLDTVVLHV